MDPIRSLSEQFNDVGQRARLREARIVARLGASKGIGRAATVQEEARTQSPN